MTLGHVFSSRVGVSDGFRGPRRLSLPYKYLQEMSLCDEVCRNEDGSQGPAAGTGGQVGLPGLSSRWSASPKGALSWVWAARSGGVDPFHVMIMSSNIGYVLLNALFIIIEPCIYTYDLILSCTVRWKDMCCQQEFNLQRPAR